MPLTSGFIYQGASEKLKEENQKLHIQFLEQQQQLEDLKTQMKFSSTVRFQLVPSSNERNLRDYLNDLKIINLINLT